MPLALYSIVVDSRDIAGLSRWWADVLGWRIGYESDDEVSVVPPSVPDRDLEFSEWAPRQPHLVFVPVPEDKQGKNRLHLDLAPHKDEDRDAYLAALEAKGARRVDVGQSPDETFDVFADPEGNEFCVLSSRRQ